MAPYNLRKNDDRSVIASRYFTLITLGKGVSGLFNHDCFNQSLEGSLRRGVNRGARSPELCL